MIKDRSSTHIKTQSKIENIGMVPEPQRTNIRSLVSFADGLFKRSGLTGSKVHDFFYECVEGQIIISLMPIKRKEGDYLSLSDFNIGDISRYDDYSEIYNIHRVILDLHLEFTQITKFKKVNYKVKDKVAVVKIIGSKSLGYKLITRDAKIINIGNMHIARPDDPVLDVFIGKNTSVTRVTKGDPHTIFWRLA